MLHAVAGGYDGYLRWAVNSWTLDPLRDSRFRTWAAGDTYSIYPSLLSHAVRRNADNATTKNFFMTLVF